MRLRLAVVMLACAELMAQTDRHFKDGEVLSVDGATVTIRYPRSSGQCLEMRGNTVRAGPTVSTCTDPGPGFFRVTLHDADVTHIEIEVGIEYYANFGNISTILLRFVDYNSTVNVGIDTAVGEISDLGAIRTIRIRLLKAKTEKLFR